MSSVQTWYYPLMHRYDLYSKAVAMVGKNPKDISEDQLYYDSCITFGMEGLDFAARGFNGKTLTFVTKPTSPTFEAHDFSTEGGYSGHCYHTLTDNKTFFIAPCCVTGGQMMWGMGSTVPELPKETVKLIHDHVESLGFKREFFARLRYDSCELGENEHKDEL